MKNKLSMFKVVQPLISVITALLVVWGVWMWVFCRFYVPPNHFAVVISKVGKQLPQGRILAYKGEKGIREEVLGEGRYFLNPVFYKHEIFPVTTIAPGYMGVVTSKIGKDLPSGEFLADENEKGIWRKPLGPGKYRFNPYGYQVDIYTALNVPIGYVGVVTSLSGKQKGDGEEGIGVKGVIKNILQPGFYYINPKEFKVDVLEVGLNQVSLAGRKILSGEQQAVNLPAQQQSLRRGQYQQERQQMANQQLDWEDQGAYNALYTKSAGKARVGAHEQKAVTKSSFFSRGGEKKQKSKKEALSDYSMVMDEQKAQDSDKNLSPVQKLDIDQFLEFPSKDGFLIMLDMTVEFELLPGDIASIFSRYGTLQEVVEKILMPHILSVARLKGSDYGAKEFIMGEGREKFQTELTDVLTETMKEKEIQVKSVLIRHVVVPQQILEPIQQASIAVEVNLTNIEKQETARKKAQLNIEQSLIEQKKQQVVQETGKIKAQIKAEMEKEMGRIEALTKKEVADIDRQIASVQAQIKTKLGEARADVNKMVGNAQAEADRLRTTAFGDPVSLSLYEMTKNFPEDLKISIIYAGPGTLWTDLDKMAAGNLGGIKFLEEKNK